jgi:hypothetical protein
MDLRRWEYYLYLEQDLLDLSRYIYFAEENLSSYSHELMKTIITVAIEFESLSKDDEFFKGNKQNHFNKISSLPYELLNVSVQLKRSDLRIKPFELAQDGKSFTWWNAYSSEIKHNNKKSLPEANLKHALQAMGALYLLLIYIYRYHWNLGGANVKDPLWLSGRDTYHRFQKIENQPRLFLPQQEDTEALKDGIVNYGQLWKTSLRHKTVTT